jgi:ABC-2 type transport system ATP-binding protein
VTWTLAQKEGVVRERADLEPHEMDGLVKSYGKVVAVCGISFQVPKGQVVGLLGPNGAGKSSTIKVCLGLTRPTRGTVRVFGSTLVAA